MPIAWIIGLIVGAGVVTAVVTGGGSGGGKTTAKAIVPPRPTPFSVVVHKTSLAPLPRLAPYDIHEHIENDRIPDGSPTGARWIVWQGSTATGRGLDSDGQWWMKIMFTAWGKVTPTGGGWLDAVSDIVARYVAPAIGVMVTAVVPGVGGIAFAAALKAWSILASGGSVSDALIGAAREKLPSLLAGTTFDKALELGRRAVPKNVLDAAKSVLVSASQRTAFDQGLVFAAAEKAQQSAVESLKRSLPDKADLIQAAMNQGAAVEDLANVFGGDKGVRFVQDIFRSKA